MSGDETLNCIDCSRQFVFTSGEQRFYESKGFQNKPTRCQGCRNARKTAAAAAAPVRTREMFSATCGNCGAAAEVPFKPRGGKPAYCRDCFASRPTYR